MREKQNCEREIPVSLGKVFGEFVRFVGVGRLINFAAAAAAAVTIG